MFFLVPLLFLGLSYLFTQKSKGLTVLGAFITIILFFLAVWMAYYCQYKGGKEKCYDCMVARDARVRAIKDLPDDMEYLKARINQLSEHTGLPEDAEEQVEEDVEEGDVKAEETEEEEAA